MAIGWLTILKSVPWSDAISNAPKLAEGAKKLWNAVAKNPPPPEPPSANVRPPMSSEVQAISELQTRVASAEATMSSLHDQMLASSVLIKSLAEQNAQLIERIELNRVRLLWTGAAAALAVILAVASLAAGMSANGV